ncbi:unnamed protein product [Pedinophyceae sp. YPF-701]|nr:unnamed protein product [Pedinophyceae sp. YPF-701]
MAGAAADATQQGDGGNNTAVEERPGGREPDADEDDEVEGLEWMLGFLEDPEHGPADLLRHRFLSKVGGRPAWLDPCNLPAPLQCGVSSKPMDFLLQVYAPVDDVDAAFHRTVSLFVTRDGSRAAERGAVRAFRCQLPRSNPFYSSEPPGESDLTPPPLPAGTAAPDDRWAVAQAETDIAAGRTCTAGDPETLLRMLPESELVVEPESDYPYEGDPEVEAARQAYLRQGDPSDADLPDSDVRSVEELEGMAERAHYAGFQARIAGAPSQVLRYCFEAGAAPLLPSPRPPAPKDVPPCPACGAPRRFEFQVMPQLLARLHLDPEDPRGLDFGTVVVYSCAASCPGPAADGGGYREEYVWVQPA